MEKEPEWTGWMATIVATEYGTFGIVWSNSPAMERRGGWSGPYNSIDEARQGAIRWRDSWHMEPDDLTIVVAA